MVTAAPPDWRLTLERDLIPPLDAPSHVHRLHAMLPPIPERTSGRRCISFIQRHCVHGEGDWYGQPFRLRWWQKRIILALYREDEDGQRYYRRALIGLPSGAGKTELVAAIGLYELDAGPTVSPLIPVAAASKEQANLVFGAARTCCEESGTLSKLNETGVDLIIPKGRPGRMYRVSAADGTNDGQRPSFPIFDELHEWAETKNTYAILTKGTAKRAGSLQLMISTAGYDLDTICGRLYQHGKRVQSGEVEDERFLFVWLEATAEMAPGDPETWQAVHPAAGDFMSMDAIRAKYHEMPIAQFRRYFLNQWVEASEQWLPTGAWRACEAAEPFELEPGAPTWVGWDAATKHDSTGIVAGQWAETDGKKRLRIKRWLWERPINPLTSQPEEDWRLPIADVEAAVRDLCERYDVKGVAYDPAFITWSAQSLEEDGLPMIEWPQTGVRMAPATQSTYQLIVEQVLEHEGDEAFRRHIAAAAAVPVRDGGGQRLAKGKARRPIDLAIALVMMVGLAAAFEDVEPPMPGILPLY